VVRQAMRLRRRIETVFGRLVTEFGIARTKGRDFWRWSARILRHYGANAQRNVAVPDG